MQNYNFACFFMGVKLDSSLMEEHMLRVFENRVRVLRKIFGPKRDEVTGE
jgi:hypothetical protein